MTKVYKAERNKRINNEERKWQQEYTKMHVIITHLLMLSHTFIFKLSNSQAKDIFLFV